VIAMHSLEQMHGWLWPMVDEAAGRSFAVGSLAAEWIRNDDVKMIALPSGNDRMMLSWSGMDGGEPMMSLGIEDASRDSGQRRLAYCSLPHGSSARRGRLVARGGDVARMFSFFGRLPQHMPQEVKDRLQATLSDERLQDYSVDGVLAIDGGLGGSASLQLHEMAMQHACSIVFDWAPDRMKHITRFLEEHGFMFGSSALTFSDRDRIVCGVEVPGRRSQAFFASVFPNYRYGDRMLSWIDRDTDGSVSSMHSYMLDEGDVLPAVVARFQEGHLVPTLSHDFRSGKTTLPDHVDGFTDLCRLARTVEQTQYAAVGYNPENLGYGHDIASHQDLLDAVERDPSPSAGGYVR
jgi:hypothetical protein